MLQFFDSISGYLQSFVDWRYFTQFMSILACALPTLLLAIQLIMYVAYQPSLGFIRHSKKFIARYGYADEYLADKYGKKVVRRAGKNIYRSWRNTVAYGDMIAAGDVLVAQLMVKPAVPEVFTPSALIWLLVVQGLGLCMQMTYSAVLAYVLVATAPWIGGFIVKIFAKNIIDAVFSRKSAKAAQSVRRCVGSRRVNTLPAVDVSAINERDLAVKSESEKYSAVEMLARQIDDMLRAGVGQDVAKVISEGLEQMLASGAYDNLETLRLLQLNSRLKKISA